MLTLYYQKQKQKTLYETVQKHIQLFLIDFVYILYFHL